MSWRVVLSWLSLSLPKMVALRVIAETASSATSLLRRIAAISERQAASPHSEVPRHRLAEDLRLANAALQALARDARAVDSAKESLLGATGIVAVEVRGRMVLDHVDLHEHLSLLGIGGCG